MSHATPPEAADGSLGRDWLRTIRYYLEFRWALLSLGAIALVLALTFNWGWLVAVGLAPVILAALPCAVMCALGLCMSRLFGNSCESRSSRSDRVAPPTGNISVAVQVSAVPDGSSNSTPGCSEERPREGSQSSLNPHQMLDERRSSNG